ncbi:hypothetical protein EDB85DRAFT_1899211 [Lactarius pseudohatsudake]|nr:hypothetical protein EDB85DRAFT_1899211 [Lactarius pseudohatsudake]
MQERSQRQRGRSGVMWALVGPAALGCGESGRDLSKIPFAEAERGTPTSFSLSNSVRVGGLDLAELSCGTYESDSRRLRPRECRRGNREGDQIRLQRCQASTIWSDDQKIELKKADCPLQRTPWWTLTGLTDGAAFPRGNAGSTEELERPLAGNASEENAASRSGPLGSMHVAFHWHTLQSRRSP